MPPKVIAGIKKAAQQAKQPLRDLAAYPILTEEVGFSPSPLATPSTGGPGGGGSSPLGQIVNKAVGDVLGWKIKPGDAKGFVGALTQSFALADVEGHVEAKWTPRSYAAQSDLAGGITGAQASVYSRGKEALDQSLPLLDGLYPLDPEADPEDVKALKAVVKSQLLELVNELGFLSGPRVSRVNQYFGLLLIDADQGSKFPPQPGPLVVNPDQVGGTLGNLRDLFGLNFDTQDFVNSVQDEQNLSNYRIMADYVTSLAQSWLSNLPYFGLDSQKPFFGTQLVLLSRQLQVVAEAVDEVRFTLDSVFIGPAERQTTILNFPGTTLSSIFLEDLLSWIRNFTTEEGPRLIQEGGKFGVQNTFTPVVREVQRFLVNLPTSASAANPLPAGFFAPRVQFAFSDLKDQLQQLITLAKPIKHEITPQPDFGLPFQIDQVETVFLSLLPQGTTATTIPVHVAGNGFQAGNVSVSFTNGPTGPMKTITPATFFRSESLLVARIPVSVPQGTWDVTVLNTDGSTLTLRRAFTVSS
jgi:hypothetical protein